MRSEVSALLAAGIVGKEQLHTDSEEPLFPEEEAAISKAVDKRRREFSAGRSCARLALSELGVAPQPLLQQADRSVAWPEGYVGSITHAEGYVGAIAAPRTVALGLGIDAERKTRVKDRLWKQIANEAEIAWFRQSTDETEQSLRATCLFSAKEAFYKAQYCVSKAWVGFHDVSLSFEGNCFEVALDVDIAGLGPRGSRYSGRQIVLGEHVISILTILTTP